MTERKDRQPQVCANGKILLVHRIRSCLYHYLPPEIYFKIKYTTSNGLDEVIDITGDAAKDFRRDLAEASEIYKMQFESVEEAVDAALARQNEYSDTPLLPFTYE